MRYRKIGKTDIQASVVGLGTWVGEDWMWGGPDERNLSAAIGAAIDSGITLINTAPVYGLGFSEEVVGKAIAGKRDQVVLATHCGLVWNTNKGKHFFDERGTPINRYLGEESIRFELDESLRRLKTDHIDLYQIQVFDPDRPIEEPLGTLVDLKQQGKIRAIGVCNPDLSQLQRYDQSGELDAIEQQYSMLDRRAELDILPFCFNNGISVLAYSPLLQGLITGRLGPDQKFAADALHGAPARFGSEHLQEVAGRLRFFDSIAFRYGIDLVQLAIAWTAQSPGISHVLVGARNIEQVRQAARAGDASLSEDDVDEINRALEANLIELSEMLLMVRF